MQLIFELRSPGTRQQYHTLFGSSSCTTKQSFDSKLSWLEKKRQSYSLAVTAAVTDTAAQHNPDVTAVLILYFKTPAAD
ncbi:hypothetical protein D7X87_19180 [bacterium D16-54]|nr:hypothetical protein D7X87_19180 [bacterium D16-54]